MCKSHLKHSHVNYEENYSRKKGNRKKKHEHILVPSPRYQDSRHLLQNQKFTNYVMGFSNRAQRFTGSNYLDVDSPFM